MNIMSDSDRIFLGIVVRNATNYTYDPKTDTFWGKFMNNEEKAVSVDNTQLLGYLRRALNKIVDLSELNEKM
jgi:hypothetical protein